jgi:hypothetical protein
MNDVIRIRFRGVFIQCRPGRNGVKGYIAWSSIIPSDDPIKAPDPVYFYFGKTANEAIDKVKKELETK